MKRSGLAILIAIGLAALGCSSQDPNVTSANEADSLGTSSPEVSSDRQQNTAPSDAARGYFSGLAEKNVSGNIAAQSFAEPDSPAFYYALYQAEYARFTEAEQFAAQRAAVDRCQTDALEVGTDVLEVGGDALRGKGVCLTYGDITTNEAGQVVSFTVNDLPLPTRMRIGGPPVSASGVTATPVVSYETALGDLAVMLEVKNDTTGLFTPYFATTYVGPDGQTKNLRAYGSSVASDDVVILSYFLERPESPYASTMAAGAVAYDIVIITDGERGGTLNYGGYDKGYSNKVDLPIPVP